MLQPMAGRARNRARNRHAQPQPPASADGLPCSERVFRQLRSMIIDGEVGPGTRLVELSLATQFGVSRTPVREALKRLVDGNLLLADPIRGLVVRTLEAAEVEEVYLVREVLDGLAARLAAERVRPDDLARLRVINDAMREGIRDGRTDVIVNANIAFHDLIYEIAGNRTLTRHGMELRTFVRRFSSEAFASPPRVAAVLRDHERLLAALERADPEAAERASIEHLREARAYVAQLHLRRAVGVAVDATTRP
ncbi:MAG TPA: GntR family transcriptional regulator [Candidatus Limnocylindria bacterium]